MNHIHILMFSKHNILGTFKSRLFSLFRFGSVLNGLILPDWTLLNYCYLLMFYICDFFIILLVPHDFFSVQIKYVLVSHTKFPNLVITIKKILIQNLHHVNKNMKQYNKVEAWRSPDEGAVEVDLISSVVSSRFCALV